MKLSIKNLGILTSLAALMAMPLQTRADHHEEKANANGTWTWTREGRDGNQVTSTLTLKADGEKLTGKMSGRGGTESDITSGKVDGSTVAFDVSRSFGGNDRTIHYTGKIAGDTLTLTSKFTGRDGQEMTREITAKRAVSLTGDWKSTFEGQNGSMEIVLALKQDGENVTGAVKVNEFEIPVKGTFKEGTLNYTSEWEGPDGNTMTSKFTGKVAGDKITGQTTRNFGGQESSRDVEYTRAK